MSLRACLLVLAVASNLSAQTLVQRDLPYGVASIRKYDSYVSAACPDPTSMPIVILIHGGGWVAGDKTADGIQLTLAPALAAKCFSVVVPNYTLAVSGAPTTHFPAALMDLKTLLSCFAELLCAPGGNPHRISIIGISAGAHYAYLMGLTDKTAFTGWADHVSTDYTIRAVVGNSTPTDLSALYAASLGARPNILALLGYVPSTNPTGARAASPVGYVGQTGVRLWLQSGTIDTLVPPTSQSVPFALAFSKLTPSVILPQTNFAGYWHADPRCAIQTDPCFTEALNVIVTYGQ